MRKLIPILFALGAFASSAPAAAQYWANEERPAMIFSTTTTTSAVAVGVIMLTVVNVNKDRAALQQYLKQNEPALRAAIGLGAGDVLTDLAAFFGIRGDDQLRAFAKLIRLERSSLEHYAWIRPDVDKFVRHMRMAMTMNPLLRSVIRDG